MDVPGLFLTGDLASVSSCLRLVVQYTQPNAERHFVHLAQHSVKMWKCAKIYLNIVHSTNVCITNLKLYNHNHMRNVQVR